jgi:hypothetical protein
LKQRRQAICLGRQGDERWNIKRKEKEDAVLVMSSTILEKVELGANDRSYLLRNKQLVVAEKKDMSFMPLYA